jgi:hypothetical protein
VARVSVITLGADIKAGHICWFMEEAQQAAVFEVAPPSVLLLPTQSPE